MIKLNREMFTAQDYLTKDELEAAFNFCLEKIDANLEEFTNRFPEAASKDLVFNAMENDGDWVQGFWTGMLQLAYEITGDEKYRRIADIHVESFLKRIEDKLGTNHHDMGFLYSLSCVSAYKLTGNERAKKAALLAADNLIARFQEKGQFIQAWGELGQKEEYRLIIDCLINLPLLYWATEVSQDEKYSRVAEMHFNTAVKLVIREDFSTHHTYFFDVNDGKSLRGSTSQGQNDNSAWARGQSWAIYGLALGYRYKKYDNLVELFKNVTNYFLNRLPSDFIPCWDLIFTDSDTQRDSSAAPIAVCGILEMMKYIDTADEDYKNAVSAIVRSLMTNYTTKGLNSNGILAHGVYSIPHGSGIDECTMWGDYFYMEALVRLLKPDWNPYW
jgi:unsaturated chondroitin disaccharide hydrolase